jgi:hypothetical protein
MSTELPVCLFCLEQSTAENTVIQFSLYKKMNEMPCTCRFNTHVECWMIYFLKKGGYECPICHAKLGVPSGNMLEQNITFQTNNRMYTISVPVDNTQTIHVELPSRNRCVNLRRIIIWALCALLLIGSLILVFTQGR